METALLEGWPGRRLHPAKVVKHCFNIGEVVINIAPLRPNDWDRFLTVKFFYKGLVKN